MITAELEPPQRLLLVRVQLDVERPGKRYRRAWQLFFKPGDVVLEGVLTDKGQPGSRRGGPNIMELPQADAPRRGGRQIDMRFLQHPSRAEQRFDIVRG